MTTEQKAITGKEETGGEGTPYQALVQFYKAFNGRSLPLMEQNWANTNAIAMDNPLGGIMRGWDNIKAVYHRIFEGQARVYVEFWDYTIHETAEMFYAVGRERGHLEVGGQQLDLRIRTSRIFQKTGGQWRQVHHHGSIADPALLKSYQELVSINP